MDLKIKDVAELLNISESTVRRWLSEGRIPSYRLNRQYRFNRAEIEDWVLRQKLGFGGEVEEKKERAPKEEGGRNPFSLYRALYRGEVLTNVPGKTKEEIFRAAMEHMAPRFDLDADVLTELFLDRENLMPTALGHGVGVPHTRDFLLPTHFDVILALFPKEPLEYGALDDKPVHTLFFLFACEDRHHLQLLAKLAHLTADEQAHKILQEQPQKEKLLSFVKDWEEKLVS